MAYYLDERTDSLEILVFRFKCNVCVQSVLRNDFFYYRYPLLAKGYSLCDAYHLLHGTECLEIVRKWVNLTQRKALAKNHCLPAQPSIATATFHMKCPATYRIFVKMSKISDQNTMIFCPFENINFLYYRYCGVRAKMIRGDPDLLWKVTLPKDIILAETALKPLWFCDSLERQPWSRTKATVFHANISTIELFPYFR